MRNKISIRLSPRWKKENEGPFYIYIRLTVNGIRANAEIGTGVKIDKIEHWEKSRQRIYDSIPCGEAKNKALDNMFSMLLQIHTNYFFEHKKRPTAKLVKDTFIERVEENNKEKIKKQPPKDFLKFFKYFLDTHRCNVEKSTFKAYKSKFNYLTMFLNEHLKITDFLVSEFKARTAFELYAYCTETKKTSRFHAIKMVRMCSQVLSRAVHEEVILSNPLIGLKLKNDPQKPIVYLTEIEVEQIENHNFDCERLQKVADFFLWQCYTSMAYNEVINFDFKLHKKIDSIGNEWIMINRGKTSALMRIPLLPKAKRILEKYNEQLPILSNQKMNEYLKEVAQYCGIENPHRMTTHLARRTAATYFLNKGVSMQSVSNILGHVSIKTTEKYYAEFNTESIGREVQHLRQA